MAKKANRKKATPKTEKKDKGKGKPRQQRLPGTDDNKIADLEAAAENYAEVRDERMALLKQEVDLQESLLKLMKKHDRVSYRRDGIKITVVEKSEKVRVRVSHGEEEEFEEQVDVTVSDENAEAAAG
jgi:hypothetical protein